MTPIVPRTHDVRRGESLTSVARRHGLSVAELARANGLKPTALLQIGQRLQIPGDAAVVAPGAQAQAQEKRAAEAAALASYPTEAPQPGGKEAPTMATMLGMIRRLEGMGVDRAWLEAECAKNGVPVEMALALIWKESKGNPKLRSPAGAKGLMMLMPRTSRAMGVTRPYDPKDNLRGGLKYLAEVRARFSQLDLSLAAYNAGPTKVAKLGRVPRNAETLEYVQLIPAWMGLARQAWDVAGASPALRR